MQIAPPDQPRLVRDRLAYIDEVNAFVLTRVEEALREWSDRAKPASTTPVERRRGARGERRSKSGAKRQAAREPLG